MNEAAAKNLVKTTFENPYSRERFLIFTKNLLKFFNPKTFIYRGKYIPEVYKSHIKTIERIGKYEDETGNKIDVLAVQLKKTSSIEQARSLQRNFIAWYLRGSRGGVHKDAALVAFYTKDSADWRFSLIKMEYELAKSKKGKLKTTTKLTPARRFSFLVGKDEASHTAQKQLLPILLEDQHTPTLKDFEDAFSVEKVTKEFFEKYRELFLQVQESLEKLTKQDKKIKKDFDNKNIDTINFSKKLLGQIVFLYFLQKKGWFGVQRNADWDTGSRQFLRELFKKKHSNYKNFFNEILEPLFYEALRNDRSHDDHYFSQFKCKIPFLNGGLFDPLNDYDWVGTDILLDNKLFSNKKEDGILDVFDRYNFTVKEDEPLEKDVAVDPEMLGKVFENLLEIKDRKSKGTYYTPREIVHYMCQESLINYLITESDLEEKTVRLLIKPKVLSKKDIRKIKNKKKSNHKIVEGTVLTLWEKDAKNLDKILANIKVCDPACGSGAFLVGMLKEIVQARKRLAFILDKETTIYDLKKQAIEKCIYGVDIDLGAVEIAKLRLWLSLIVDEKDIKNIKPLPNLDYKVMQGNSLIEFISPESLARTTDSKRNQLIDQFNQLKQEYLTTYTPSEKKQKRQKINELTQKIISYDREQEKQSLWSKLLGLKSQQKLFMEKPSQLALGDSEKKKQKLEKRLKELKKIQQATPADHFEWHLNFNEVFDKNEGFDVVIANPPYIRQENIKSLKDRLNQYKVYTGTADILVYFYELGINLLCKGGVLAFITSNKFMRAGYGRKLRSFMISKTTIKTIIDFGDLPVFEATAYPVIVIARKAKASKTSVFKGIKIKTMNELRLLEKTVKDQSLKIDQKELNEKTWVIADTIDSQLMLKIESSATPLSEFVGKKFYRGITTGLNKAFIIDEEEYQLIIKEDPKSSEVLKPFLRGRDIKRYLINDQDLYLIYIRHGWTNMNRKDSSPELFFKNSYRAIYKRIKKFQLKLKKRDDKGEYWWEMRPCKFLLDFEKKKIVYPDIAKRCEFAFDEDSHFLGNTSYMIPTDSLFLLGILNSSTIEYWYRFKSAQIRGGFLRFIATYMASLPIIRVTETQKKGIENNVKQILNLKTKGRDTIRLEQEIDQLVYKLYGLTSKEIKIVEGGKNEEN